jgi:hypothetical protein
MASSIGIAAVDVRDPNRVDLGLGSTAEPDQKKRGQVMGKIQLWSPNLGDSGPSDVEQQPFSGTTTSHWIAGVSDGDAQDSGHKLPRRLVGFTYFSRLGCCPKGEGTEKSFGLGGFLECFRRDGNAVERVEVELRLVKNGMSAGLARCEGPSGGFSGELFNCSQ